MVESETRKRDSYPEGSLQFWWDVIRQLSFKSWKKITSRMYPSLLPHWPGLEEMAARTRPERCWILQFFSSYVFWFVANLYICSDFVLDMVFLSGLCSGAAESSGICQAGFFYLWHCGWNWTLWEHWWPMMTKCTNSFLPHERALMKPSQSVKIGL